VHDSTTCLIDIEDYLGYGVNNRYFSPNYSFLVLCTFMLIICMCLIFTLALTIPVDTSPYMYLSDKYDKNEIHLCNLNEIGPSKKECKSQSSLWS